MYRIRVDYDSRQGGGNGILGGGQKKRK